MLSNILIDGQKIGFKKKNEINLEKWKFFEKPCTTRYFSISFYKFYVHFLTEHASLISLWVTCTLYKICSVVKDIVGETGAFKR